MSSRLKAKLQLFTSEDQCMPVYFSLFAYLAPDIRVLCGTEICDILEVWFSNISNVFFLEYWGG